MATPSTSPQSPSATFSPTVSHVTSFPGSQALHGSITLGDMLENALEHNPITGTPHANLVGQAEAQVLAFANGAQFATFATVINDFAQINQILSTNLATDSASGAPPPSFSIAKATTLTVAQPGVEANTPGGVPHLVSTVSHGSLTLGAPQSLLGAGGFAYTPNAGYVGPDSFTFQNEGAPGLHTVHLNVTPPIGSAPVANNDLFATPPNPQFPPSLTVDGAHGVLANDVDPFGRPLAAHLVSAPQLGHVSLASNGGFTYTGNSAGQPVDHFTYVAGNEAVNSPPQTVWIGQMATGVNTPVNDSYTVPADQPTNIPAAQGVLENDVVHTGSVAAFLKAPPQHGTVSLAPDGGFEYIPTHGFAGVDHFTYVDSNGSPTNAATVAIGVAPHTPFGIL